MEWKLTAGDGLPVSVDVFPGPEYSQQSVSNAMCVFIGYQKLAASTMAYVFIPLRPSTRNRLILLCNLFSNLMHTFLVYAPSALSFGPAKPTHLNFASLLSHPRGTSISRIFSKTAFSTLLINSCMLLAIARVLLGSRYVCSLFPIIILARTNAQVYAT